MEKVEFETLLWLLDPDREGAETAYARLLQRLILFFRRRTAGVDAKVREEAERACHRWCRCLVGFDAEDLARNVMTTLARDTHRRLAGFHPTEVVRPTVVHGFPDYCPAEFISTECQLLPTRALALARRVFHERSLAAHRVARWLLAAPPPCSLQPSYPPDTHGLQRALDKLGAEDSDLIRKYFVHPEEDKGRSRQQVAKALGLTVPILKSRIEAIKSAIWLEVAANRR
jgi:hypothetical protein